MQHNTTDRREIGGETHLNARILTTLVLALAVVLAGCAGIGGLGGDSGSDNAGDGVAEADTPSGGGAGDDGSNNSTNDDMAVTTADGDDRANDGDNQSSDDVSSNESAAGDALSGSDDADGSSASTTLNEEEEWFNLSKPGRYVFEIESAEEGTGSMVFETTEVSNGQTTVSFQYDLGEESFESTITGPIGEVEPQIATSPAYAYLITIRLGGLPAGMLSGGEDLQVGNEFSQQSAEGSMHIEVTGIDSYAGVDCYVIESRMNETLTQEICTQQAFSSAPYVAFYDENGDLEQRVELVEYERR